MTRVVILGAGHAGVTLATTLAQRAFTGDVTLIEGEAGAPTQRPPLSKAYLRGEASAEAIVLKPLDWFPANRMKLLSDTRAVSIDRARRIVETTTGNVPYDRLVIATGAANRRLCIPGEDLDGVIQLRNRVDADRLAERLRTARRLVLVGAGFIGLEIAAVACRLGIETIVVEAGSRALARSVSAPMADHLVTRHRAEGVSVRFDAGCVAVEGDRAVRGVRLATGEAIPADIVLIAVGVVPADTLASAAGVPTNNGILVDGSLATADPAIDAIGDCACFPDRSGGWLRLESVQNAADQARVIAARLMGEKHLLTAVPWFWSEQFDMKLMIAGVARPDDLPVSRDLGDGRIAVARLRDGYLVALETVNLAADHMLARRLVADRVLLDPASFADPSVPFKATVRAMAETH